MADWLIVDEAYAGQMALRDRLLAERRDAVLALLPGAEAAAAEVLETVLAHLPDGFRREGRLKPCAQVIARQQAQGDEPGRGHARRAATSIRVEPSLPSALAVPSSTGPNAVASSLPSSTPHWS